LEYRPADVRDGGRGGRCANRRGGPELRRVRQSSDKHEVACEVRKGLMALEPGEDVLSVFRDVIVRHLRDRDAGTGAGTDADAG